MTEPDKELTEVHLAHFLSGADTAELLDGAWAPETDVRLTFTVFVLSAVRIGEMEPDGRKFSDRLIDTLETFGMDHEVAVEFVDHHGSGGGYSNLCRVHEDRPNTPGFNNFRRSWRFNSRKFFQDYPDHRPWRH